MQQKSELDHQYLTNSVKIPGQRILRDSSFRPIRVSKCTGLLLYCLILIVDFTYAKQINHNINIANQQGKLYNLLDSKQRQCLIGLQIESQAKNVNSLLFPTATIIELSHRDAIKAKQPSKWQYCLIRNKQQLSKRQMTYLSRDWQQCLEKCCATIFQDQCYFKASFINSQPVNKFTLSPNLRKYFNPNNNHNTNINDLAIDKMRLLQGNSNSNGDGTVANGGQIVLIVITCIFGVPLLLLIIFAIISIVKMCRLRSIENATNIVNGQHGTQNVIAEEVHLDEYKMQQMGPFHVNLQQQCSICLDEKVNLRTRCGHFYHPQCIKAWIVRGKSRCPVCNCTRLNPMKVYCKRCYVGVKLVVLDGRTEDKVVEEIGLLECENCGSDNMSEGLSPVEKTQKKSKNKNDNQAKKKGAASATAKQKSSQQPKTSKVTQPRQPQKINHSSSSSSNQQQLNVVIPPKNISREHNQNQLMQSLALRASTHHFLRQTPSS